MNVKSRFTRVFSLSVASLLVTGIGIAPQARAAAACALAGLQEQEQKPSENRPEEPKATTKASRPEETKPVPKEAKPPKEEAKPRSEEKERASKAQSPAQNHARPAAQGHYQFRAQDVVKLRQYYQSRLKSVDPTRRQQLVVGSAIPQQVVTYIEPVPVEIVEVLAVPAGYVVGYWDGYCIVYDPNTLIIVAVADLLIV